MLSVGRHTALGLPRDTLSQTPKQNKWGKKEEEKESKKKAEKKQKQ